MEISKEQYDVFMAAIAENTALKAANEKAVSLETFSSTQEENKALKAKVEKMEAEKKAFYESDRKSFIDTLEPRFQTFASVNYDALIAAGKSPDDVKKELTAVYASNANIHTETAIETKSGSESVKRADPTSH